MNVFDQPKFSFPLLIELFGLIFYSWVALALWLNPKVFTSAFFKLFLFGFVLNVFTYANSFPCMRIPQNTVMNGTFSEYYVQNGPENPNPNYLTKITHALHYQLAYDQYSYSFLVCFNRFSMMYWQTADQYWKSLWILIIAAIIILSNVAVIGIWWNKSFYRYNANENYFWIDTTYGRGNIYKILAPVLTVITCFNFLLNVFLLLRLKKLQRQNIRVPERSLFQMTISVCLIDGFLTILAFLNMFLSNSHQNDALLKWVFWLIPFASDLLTFSPPFLLFFFCKQVRGKCVKMVPGLRNFRHLRYFDTSRSIAVVQKFRSSIY